MHHLSAFWNTGQAINTTDTIVVAVPDQAVNVISSRYQFQVSRRIIRAFAGIPDGSVCRLDAPSFNRFVRPIIDPIDADATLGGNLPAVYDCGLTGPMIPKLENFAPLATRAGAGVADVAVGIWSTANYQDAPQGTITTVRGTSNSTGAKGIWNLGQVTFDQALPNAAYWVVGMRVTGANCLFARLVFPNQVDRPGCMCNVDPTAYISPSFRFGSGGLFGQFTNTNPPQIEVLGTGAVAVQALSMDLIPTTTL